MRTFSPQSGRYDSFFFFLVFFAFISINSAVFYLLVSCPIKWAPELVPPPFRPAPHFLLFREPRAALPAPPLEQKRVGGWCEQKVPRFFLTRGLPFRPFFKHSLPPPCAKIPHWAKFPFPWSCGQSAGGRDFEGPPSDFCSDENENYLGEGPGADPSRIVNLPPPNPPGGHKGLTSGNG